jgi:transposase
MLSVRRRQLVEMAVEEKNRLEKAQFDEEKSFINGMIANLNKQQETIEKLMRKLIEADPILKAKIDVLTSLKGIGLITAAVPRSFWNSEGLKETPCLNLPELRHLIGKADLWNTKQGLMPDEESSAKASFLALSSL